MFYLQQLQHLRLCLPLSVQAFFKIKAHQMERFQNALDSSHMSIWKRAHRKAFRKGRQNLECECSNYLSITSKRTNKTW